VPERRILLSGWAGYALLLGSYAILTPYLQLFLGARGFSPSRIGLLLGCFELAGIAGPILVTLLADRLQRYRRFIALSLLGAVAFFLLLHASRSFAAAFPLVIGLGFCYRSAIPLTDALFGRVLDDPSRQYGLIRVAGSAGFIAVSLVLQLTGWVTGARPVTILVAFAALAVPAALITAVLPVVPRRAPGPRASVPVPTASPVRAAAGFDARFWTVIAVLFLARFGISAHYSFFSLFLRDSLGVANVSGIWALGSLAEVPMILFSGWIINKIGVRAILTVAVAAVTVRLALYGLFPTLAVVVPAQVLHAFTFGALHTASVAFVNTKIDASRRGLGMALYNTLSIGLASFVASSAGGYLLEAAGFRGLFLVYAAVPVLGLAVLALRGGKLFALPRARGAATLDPCEG
jgi:PPP family 3-phenylpropionic acid transporter